jgi:hypothetical protein
MARPGLLRNRKFIRLSRALDPYCPGVGGDIVAAGVLELLWSAAYEKADEYVGDALDVENAAHWRGGQGILCDALRSAGGDGKPGFIESVGYLAGEYRIHDFWDHAPNYVRERAEREAKREFRGESIIDQKRRAGRARWDRHKSNSPLNASADADAAADADADARASAKHIRASTLTPRSDRKEDLKNKLPSVACREPSAPAAPVQQSERPGGNGRGKQPELSFEPPAEDAKDTPGNQAVYQVFAHWRELFGQAQAQLDGARARVIKQAIGWRRKALGCTRAEAVEEVKAALEAALNDPWVQGNNRTGEPITELRVLLGTAAVFEKLMAAARGETSTEGANSDDESLYPVLNPGGES